MNEIEKEESQPVSKLNESPLSGETLKKDVHKPERDIIIDLEIPECGLKKKVSSNVNWNHYSVKSEPPLRKSVFVIE